MVTVRVQRAGNEVLGESPDRVAVTNLDQEIAGGDDGTGSIVRVQAVRVEVLAKSPGYVSIVNLDEESAVGDAGSGSVVRVQRASIEVLIRDPSTVSVVNYDQEAAVRDSGTGSRVRVQRVVLEILQRTTVSTPVPRAYPAALHLFLHNWEDPFELECSYETDITEGNTTLSEERVGTQQRPLRALTFRWTRAERVEVERVIGWLRRSSDEPLALPLLCDATEVTVDSAMGQPTVFCRQPDRRRFFQGGRVIVYPTPRGYFTPSSVFQMTVLQVFSDRIVFTGNLPQSLQAGRWDLAPGVDIDEILEPEIELRTALVVDAKITAFESRGKSALPPVATGLPAGWQVQLGMPVFEPSHNWIRSLRTAPKRAGERMRQGRGFVTHKRGARFYQNHEFGLLLDRRREDEHSFWSVLQMFDSRRGRLVPFWLIDFEQHWTIADTDPTFIDVTPLGEFDEFAADFDFAGIIMNDGTVYIREVVTVQVNAGNWRLTLTGDPLPDPIDLTQVRRFSRARVSRFSSDAMKEVWRSGDVVEVDLAVRELLAEKDIDLGV